MASRVRLVALVAVWSWDHWLDVNHDVADLRPDNSGPDGYEHILVATFDPAPSDGEVRRALEDLRVSLSGADGHAELHSHALMDDGTWRRFLSPTGGTPASVDATGVDAVIRCHRRLHIATQAGINADAVFTEDRLVDPSGMSNPQSP